jgi:hypothetical protein
MAGRTSAARPPIARSRGFPHSQQDSCAARMSGPAFHWLRAAISLSANLQEDRASSALFSSWSMWWPEEENAVGHSEYDPAAEDRHPWNAGRMVGAKRALKPQQVWAIRFWLDRERRLRDRAMFDFAIDSKLRGCDVVKVKMSGPHAGHWYARGCLLRNFDRPKCPVRSRPASTASSRPALRLTQSFSRWSPRLRSGP